MRLITIDNGNTNPNVAIHENGKVILHTLLENYQYQTGDFILISSVGKKLNLQASIQLSQFREDKSFFDMPVQYSLSLGEDRLVTGYFAYKSRKQNESVMVVDAGTFITCDLINDKGFSGGYIFPGIERFLSSYALSQQLPHLTTEQYRHSVNTKINDLPHSTEEAILLATRFYLYSTIGNLIKEFTPDRIILTGGSADDIKKIFNSEVPFEMAPHLVHSALRLLFELHLQAE